MNTVLVLLGTSCSYVCIYCMYYIFIYGGAEMCVYSEYPGRDTVILFISDTLSEEVSPPI